MASRATVAVKVWLRMVCRRFATLALADLTKARFEPRNSHAQPASFTTTTCPAPPPSPLSLHDSLTTTNTTILRHHSSPRPPPPQLLVYTQVFLSGFFWQLGGFLAQDGLHLANTNAWYSLCTGIGDGLGVFIGTVIFDALVYALFGIGGLGRDSFANALVLVCGGVCSGAAWQPMLNAVSDAGMPFVQGACVVGSACGLFFWAGVSAGELVKMQTGEGSPRSKRREYRRELYFSATLSLAIAGAAACFVGTDAKYRGNFLQVAGEPARAREIICT